MGDDLSSHCAFESSKKIPLSDSKVVIQFDFEKKKCAFVFDFVCLKLFEF